MREKLARAAAVAFWVALLGFLAFLALFAASEPAVSSTLGQAGFASLSTVLLLVVVASSGLLARHYRRENAGDNPDRYWKGMEIIYATIFVVSCFLSLYFVPAMIFSVAGG